MMYPPGADTLVQHGLVIVSVCRGQVLEERVVRSGGDACVHWFTLEHKTRRILGSVCLMERAERELRETSDRKIEDSVL